MTEILNPAFKVKVGSVPDPQIIASEEGGLLFNSTNHGLYYADGFNWNLVQPKATAIAVVSTPVVIPLAAATPLSPAPWFDVIEYILDVQITPSIIVPDVTINTTAVYRFQQRLTVSCDTPGATVKFRVMNGLVAISEVEKYFSNPNPEIIDTLEIFRPLTAGDILTLEIESDIAAEITFQSAVGLSLVG